MLYDHSDTGGNRDYQGGGQDDFAGIKMKRLNKEPEIFIEFL